MKKSFYVVGCVLLCTVVCVSSIAAVPVSVMELKKLTPVDTFYTGKTVAIGTDSVGATDAKPGLLAFDISSRIKYVKPVGSLVFNPIYDVDGNVVRKGTVVASAYKERQENALQAAILAKKIAEEENAIAKKDFLRIENLFNKKVGSQKEYFAQKSAFLKARLSLDEKNNALELASWDLKACDLIAPFSGIVTQVWRGANRWAGDGDEVVTIQRMDPMMVKIPFPDEIIELLNKDTKVMVYPQSKSHVPVDSWVQLRTTDFDNIYAYVANKLVPTDPLTTEEIKLPKIYKVAPVMEIYSNNPINSFLANKKPYNDNIPLAVPEEAIRKDKNGDSFVFVAKSVDDSNIVDVRQVKVVPGKILRDYNLGTQAAFKLRSLKDAGDLKKKDIIVAVGTDDLKDGKAVYTELGWLFLPDQLLKLSIPSLSKPGLYVSRNAIIRQAAGENYVYIDNNGTAKLVRVKITGTCFGNYAIEGEGIEAGTKVVVLDNKAEIGNLYDGVELKVVKTLPAPERITHKRAEEIAIPLEKIPEGYYF